MTEYCAEYINPVNYNPVDSQIIGIIIMIPVTDTEERPVIAKYSRCEKCERQAGGLHDFCSICGGKIIKVTEKLKSYGGKWITERIPLPDIRKEMEGLGIENHLPFAEDLEDDPVWKFVFKEYAVVGDPSDRYQFFKELNITQIACDIKEAEEKFKTILNQYNGKVVFGVVGDFADW